jgi:hypothetical protein
VREHDPLQAVSQCSVAIAHCGPSVDCDQIGGVAFRIAVGIGELIQPPVATMKSSPGLVFSIALDCAVPEANHLPREKMVRWVQDCFF